MNTIILFLIILGTVLYVVLPFLRKKSVLPSKIGQEDGRLGDLYEYRDNLLVAIKDLELDREMGKISEKDFTEIGKQYRHKAITVLKDIDLLEESDSLSKKIEEKSISQRQKQVNKGKDIFCPACGTAIGTDDHFCSQCGKRLLKDSL